MPVGANRVGRNKCDETNPRATAQIQTRVEQKKDPNFAEINGKYHALPQTLLNLPNLSRINFFLRTVVNFDFSLRVYPSLNFFHQQHHQLKTKLPSTPPRGANASD